MCTSIYDHCTNCGGELDLNDVRFEYDVMHGSMYTVVGFAVPSTQRFAEHQRAGSAREAEDTVRAIYGARYPQQRIEVCGVIRGKCEIMDNYATFLDPDALDASQVSTIHIPL